MTSKFCQLIAMYASHIVLTLVTYSNIASFIHLDRGMSYAVALYSYQIIFQTLNITTY